MRGMDKREWIRGESGRECPQRDDPRAAKRHTRTRLGFMEDSASLSSPRASCVHLRREGHQVAACQGQQEAPPGSPASQPTSLSRKATQSEQECPGQLLTLSFGYRTLEMFSAKFRSRTASM